MMSNAPVNVKLQNPTIPIRNWPEEASKWERLNHEIGGNPNFFPLTIKGAYIIGVIHDLCQSMDILLHDSENCIVTYMPAYGMFASGIDLLGRCIQGNRTTSCADDLITGFKWLASSDYSLIPKTHNLVATSCGSYPIQRLVALRHFAAHGQATPKPIHSIDGELLGKLLPLLANGLQRYWINLGCNEDLCNKLALANVIPFRNWPVNKSWILFERDRDGKYHSVEDIFNRFDWS